MEALATVLVPFIPQAAIPLVICVCFCIYIQAKRKETKSERDQDSQAIHDKILKHEFEISNLKGDLSLQHNVNDDLNKQIVELSKAVAQFSVAVDTLTQAVAELKQDIRDMRNK